jgi:HK97 family phage prohead protease
MTERLSFGVANAKFEAGVFSGTVHAYGTVTVDGRAHGFEAGIFRKDIAAGKVRAYWGHQPSLLRLGSQKAGTLQLEDTGSLVNFAVKPPDTSYVKDLKAIVDAGEEIGVSFEFYPGKFKKVDGVKVWTEGKLDQINFVDDPAFQGTSVILNSAQEQESAQSQTVKIRARALAKV